MTPLSSLDIHRIQDTEQEQRLLCQIQHCRGRARKATGGCSLLEAVQEYLKGEEIAGKDVRKASQIWPKSDLRPIARDKAYQKMRSGNVQFSDKDAELHCSLRLPGLQFWPGGSGQLGSIVCLS